MHSLQRPNLGAPFCVYDIGAAAVEGNRFPLFSIAPDRSFFLDSPHQVHGRTLEVEKLSSRICYSETDLRKSTALEFHSKMQKNVLIIMLPESRLHYYFIAEKTRYSKLNLRGFQSC
jgi:hypothetical protein